LNARTELLFVLRAFFVGVCRCFVSLYGVIESDLAVFHSLGMISFSMVLGSGAMCLGRILMMLGGFKVCVFCHIRSPCPELPFWKPSLHIYDSRVTSCGLFRIAHTAQLIEHNTRSV
jgi:hypothetical protein